MRRFNSEVILWDFIHKDNKPKKRPKNKKKNKKKKIKKESFVHEHDYFDDFNIEAKPVFSKHAKDRLKQGRQGSYVTKTKKNKKIVVTVLPHGKNHEIATIHQNRKNNINEKINKYYIK